MLIFVPDDLDFPEIVGKYLRMMLTQIQSIANSKNSFCRINYVQFRSLRQIFSVVFDEILHNSVVNDGSKSSPKWVLLLSQSRYMTTSRRVQDRSKKKRVHDLEIATEKWKIASKVLFVMEILKNEPEQIITLRDLERYRRQINLRRPHKLSDFLRKSPKLFELYKDQKGVLWLGLTGKAEDLLEEEARIQKEHESKMVELVTRFLMMSVDKTLRVDKIAHFRRDLGLPDDFRKRWIHMFPQHFKVITVNDIEYLELTSWNPEWAVTELEKKAMAWSEVVSHSPGLICLPFPLKFPPNYKKIFRYGGSIEHFQKLPYMSPYADPTGLQPGSLEFDKRAVAVMHELLSFTIEKRLVTDHLTHFRQEFVMPQKLMRLLLKHCGIFYVSERGKRFNVFLTEAYEGLELIEKHPLVLWKEKIQSFIGYRGRRKRPEIFNGLSEGEGEDLFDDHRSEENSFMGFEDRDAIGFRDDNLFNGGSDDREIEIEEIEHAYVDNDPT